MASITVSVLVTYLQQGQRLCPHLKNPRCVSQCWCERGKLGERILASVGGFLVEKPHPSLNAVN